MLILHGIGYTVAPPWRKIIYIDIYLYLNLKVYNYFFLFKVIRKSLVFSNFQVDTNDIVVPN